MTEVDGISHFDRWGPLRIEVIDLVDALVRMNLAAAAVVLLVLALRPFVRRWAGAEAAYGLWAAPPLAVFAALISPLLPARIGVGTSVGAPPEHTALLLTCWLAGICLAVAFMSRAQAAFEREVRRGRSGPAVVGVISPRVVLPADDGHYSDEERALIRAHERTHIERGDPRAIGLMAAFQTMFWFNPLIHVAAYFLRIDQELACDAAVLRRRPSARAAYARALLKTHLSTSAPPFACHWGAHPLEVRVAALKAARNDSLIGRAVVTAGVLGVAGVVWAAQPPAPPTEPFVSMVESANQDQPTMSVMIISAPARD